MKVVIAGGSGFLGRSLGRWLLANGHQVVVLTRHPDSRLDLPQVHWDARTAGDWAGELESSSPIGIVNLAGKLVDCRPTAANIAALTSSRVDATRTLVEASRQASRPVDRWIQSSTTAIWSDAGELRLDESSAVPDQGLPQMTGVAKAWEAAFEGANAKRHNIIRTSIVLADDCPAWKRLALLARTGMGGGVGSGRQWFSWIHLDDWLRMTEAALGLDPVVQLADGVVVGAAPSPVRNSELMSELRRHFHRPGIPTPKPLLRIGAVLLRTDPQLALTGRHATSRVLSDAGFVFRHPTLRGAISRLR